jgi:hypothetical protein
VQQLLRRRSQAFTAATSPRHDRGNESGTDLFIADKLNVRGLYHRVSRLDHGDEAFALDHS